MSPLELSIAAGIALAVLLGAAVPVILHHRRRDRAIREKLDRAKQLGTNVTLSLHPRIDEGLCIGCEECVRGCPEQDVLATYRHKAVVVDAVECVGHGVCERACPVGAITLVIGTETRGLEIPKLSEQFETNVPGLFVVGELGGMGLIRNAIWQASQAVAHIAQLPRQELDGTDLLIVGAGPAGLAAALAAREAKLSFRVIEQGELGGSMLHYPRRKLVMTHAVALAGVGVLPFREVEKEALLAFWAKTLADNGVTVQCQTRLERMERVAGGFVAHTSSGPLSAGRVIVALGRRGTPRRLDVPGEESAKVYYRLIEPEKFDGLRVTVAGAGSAGIEAALALAERPGTQVTLVNRRGDFPGARAKLVEGVLAAEAAGRLEILRHAQVTRIESVTVHFTVGGEPAERLNDFVIVLVGGTPPYEILKASGVDLETRFGTPLVVRRAS